MERTVREEVAEGTAKRRPELRGTLRGVGGLRSESREMSFDRSWKNFVL